MEAIQTLAVLAALPVVCICRLLLSCVVEQERQKTWRRVIVDSMFRWFVNMHPVSRLAYLLGPSQDIYLKWAKRNKIEPYMEDVGENAKLFWILNEKWRGEMPSRVILYLHGGGFHLPLLDDAASFWQHMQKRLKDSYELDVGVAILDYSLMPEANFPVPLLQSVTAIKHLFSRGVQPSNIILMGDSAGANLANQVLLHIIHPVPGLPTVFESSKENSKFAGAYLMSPWLTLLPREDSSKNCYRENAMWDVISPSILIASGNSVLSGVEDANLPYIDSYFAPPNWYDGLGGVVKKVLITAGRYECLREDIIKFGKHLESAGRRGELDVRLVVGNHGVHDDPIFDFLAGEKRLGELTPTIISWCHSAFSES